MDVEIQIINKSNNKLPEVATTGSAGFDLRAFIQESIILKPNQRELIGTGLYMSIPIGYEGQIRSRSGLAYKNGIIVLNSPGTIDSDYRGEIKVILFNTSNETFTINNGDRVAQIVFSSYHNPVFNVVTSLDESNRHSGGFGSTGIE